MGRKRIIIDKDSNLFVDGKRYEGTRGLWELIVKNKPETSVYDDDDVINYTKIIKRTGAMINLKNPQKPAGNSQGYKWANFIQRIWEKHSQEQKQEAERQKKEAKRQKQEVKRQKQEAKLQNKKTQGKGFLPSDPNALCERLELLMASKQAGNTGLRIEIVSICDELLRQKILSHDAYKNLMLALNK